MRLSTRHTAHFGRIAARLVDELGSPREGDAAAEAERRFPDLRAAVVWATGHDLDDAIEQLAWLATALARRGSPGDERLVLRHQRPAARLRDDPARRRHPCLRRPWRPRRRPPTSRTRPRARPPQHAPRAPGAGTRSPCTSGDFERAIEHLERLRRVRRDVTTRDRTSRPPMAPRRRARARQTRSRPDRRSSSSPSRRRPVGRPASPSATRPTPGSPGPRDPQHSLDAYTRVIDIAASVGNWYVEATAQRLRLNVQFAVLPPDELASVTVDVLRRFHAMGDPLDVTHTVSFALVVLADADGSRRRHWCSAG